MRNTTVACRRFRKGSDLESQMKTLTEAQAAIEEIKADRMRIVGLRGELAKRLEAAEAIAGESYLAGDRGAVREIGEFEAEISLIERRALPELDRRQARAEVELKRATAADLRQQAERKKDELALLEQKTAKHLQALSELEETEYDGCILQAQRAGEWVTLQGGLNRPAPWQGPLECTTDPTNHNPYAVPRSRRLRDEIAGLELKAGEIETGLGRGE